MIKSAARRWAVIALVAITPAVAVGAVAVRWLVAVVGTATLVTDTANAPQVVVDLLLLVARLPLWGLGILALLMVGAQIWLVGRIFGETEEIRALKGDARHGIEAIETTRQEVQDQIRNFTTEIRAMLSEAEAARRQSAAEMEKTLADGLTSIRTVAEDGVAAARYLAVVAHYMPLIDRAIEAATVSLEALGFNRTTYEFGCAPADRDALIARFDTDAAEAEALISKLLPNAYRQNRNDNDFMHSMFREQVKRLDIPPEEQAAIAEFSIRQLAFTSAKRDVRQYQEQLEGERLAVVATSHRFGA